MARTVNWKDRIRDPDCTLCPLHTGADYVCLMGTGSKKAKIMVVGEAPGEREDAEHAAFVGASGQLLDELLGEIGLSRNEIYLTNVAKCRPPENDTPDKPHIKVCVSEYLSQEFERVDPEYVLLLGNSALYGVLGKSGITKHRGTPFDLGTATALATFHPAYGLRNPRNMEPIKADFARFGRMVKGLPEVAVRSKVRIVRSRKGLEALRDKLLSADEIAFDLETGYDKKKDAYHQPWQKDAGVVCIQFSVVEGEAYVVPLWHHQSPWLKKWQKVLKFFKPALQRSDVKYIAHNGKFDVRWLSHFGIYTPLTFDTMLAGHMLDENRYKNLQYLAEIFCGAPNWKDFDTSEAYDSDLRELARYGGRDTDYTLRLYHVLREQLKQQPRIARVFKLLMMPASTAMVRVERAGLPVDNVKLNQITTLAQRKKVGTERKLMKYVPPYARGRINFRSPQQVAHWMFTELGLPILERTKTKQPSTNESVMLRLASKHPAPKLLLEHRKYTKYLNTYLEPWRERQDEQGRIHTTYKLFGTVTGRLSSEKPNLQQVPRESLMRTVFGAPMGWTFVEADYSQVELRIAAMLADEGTLLRIFSTGGDPHLTTAAELTSKIPEDITSEERKHAKPVNFGFLYGMGHKKLPIYALDNYGVVISEADAYEYRQRYFRLYPKLPEWHDRQRRLAKRYGYVQSPIGRVRHLPDIRSNDNGVRAEAERQAINSPVQSFASDLMLLSLIELMRILPQGEVQIVGTVHDSILFLVRDQALNWALPTIRDVMEDMSLVRKKFGTDMTVPIAVEIKYGSHWGNGTVWNEG